MKESMRVLAALIAGLAIGAAIAASGNATLLRVAGYIAPAGTIWVNAIRMTVIPLVVSLLIGAVASAVDLRAVGRLGGRTMLVFIALLVGLAIVMAPLVPLAFSGLHMDVGTRSSLPPGAVAEAASLAASGESTSFAGWVASLIPPNPVAAAASGAMLQIILFTLLLALAISQSPTVARETLLGFFRALGEAMLVLVRWIVALAPVGVFGLVLPLAARGGFAVAGAVGYYIVVYAAACLLATLLLYPCAAIVGRVPLGRFARAALPAQLFAFSSSSSIAALPALVEAAERDLELPERMQGFVLPLAVSVFKVAAPVSWPVGAFFIGRFYGIELHAAQLGVIFLAAVFLAFAVPGVPRGAFLLLTPLFLAIGLPAEGIGILIAIDAVPDLFATVLNVTGDLTAAVLVARGHALPVAPTGSQESPARIAPT
jgi:proton glutamate symport protein